MRELDVAIIGAGTAGLSARSQVAKVTDNYLVFDGGKLGTTCARVGCMPSKVLIQLANDFHVRTKLSRRGISGSEHLKLDGAAAMAHVRSLRDRFVRAVNGSMDSWVSTHLVRHHARLLSGNTLLLKKRPELGAYVRGQVPENPDNNKSASLDLAHEFASKPDPVTGQSVYPPPNKVGKGITVRFVRETLRFSHIASLSVAKLYPRVSDYSE